MKRYLIVVFCACFFSCSKKETQEFSSKEIALVVEEMTALMVQDITNPPLAARFFAYAMLAGYETVALHNSQYKSMHGVLKKFPKINVPVKNADVHYQLAAVLAMLETAKKLQPSGSLLNDFEKAYLDSLKTKGFDEAIMLASKAVAEGVSQQILTYAKADGYNKISNLQRYTPGQSDSSWFPTPPAFIAAVEPNFNTVRPLTLDTCNQFVPAPPVPFSKEKKSAFQQMLLQNYNEALTNEKRLIAGFWDCNPFAVQDNGHLLIGLKKISPGAHWMGITGIACRDAKKSFNESMAIHTTVAIGLLDGFICCWDEKYRSNRIRPETAIRRYIDPKWQPLLQTPPFPEYVSGHSVVSAASATILSHFFGEAFSYTDDVEVRYDLPPRKFASFKQAAQEAGISRFYGGIHYMDAVNEGLKQGEKVGAWVLQKVVNNE